MSVSSATPTAASTAPPVRISRVFAAFLARDFRVVFRKQLLSFLARVLVEPLMLVFVFSYVLPSVSGGRQVGGRSFSTVITPGLLANTMLFAGVLGVTMPLISELSYPKTVQDRLLTPVPVWAVGAGRLVSGAAQALVSVLLVLPIVVFLHAPGQAPDIEVANWPLLVAVVLFGSLLSAAFGLWLGSVVQPAQVNVLFSLVMMPAMMLGCVYYPWAALDTIPWLQMVVLLNPVVYLSEGLRAALTPGMPHLPLWAVLLTVLGGSVLISGLGLRAFRRAALD